MSGKQGGRKKTENDRSPCKTALIDMMLHIAFK